MKTGKERMEAVVQKRRDNWKDKPLNHSNSLRGEKRRALRKARKELANHG